MATGFTTNGIDLDDVFDPYIEGTKTPATGYSITAGDLSQRYAPLTYGAQAPATGFVIADGADINTLWAAKGTATYTKIITPDFGIYTAISSGNHDTGCAFSLSINSDGTWWIVLSANKVGQGSIGETSGTPLNGLWLSGGSAADYEVRFTVTSMDNDISVFADEPNSAEWTDSTGWLSLSSNRLVSAVTGHYVNGAVAAAGMLSGTYLVEIRKIGTDTVVSSSVDISLTVGFVT